MNYLSTTISQWPSNTYYYTQCANLDTEPQSLSIGCPRTCHCCGQAWLWSCFYLTSKSTFVIVSVHCLPCADLAWYRCKESSSQDCTHWFTQEGSSENMTCPMSRTGLPRYLRPQNYHSHPFAIRKVAVDHLSRGKRKETPGAQTGFTEHLLCARSSGYSLIEFSETASQGKL